MTRTSAVRGKQGGQKLLVSTADTRLPNISQYKLWLHLPPFGRNSDDNIGPPKLYTSFGGVGWAKGVENGTNWNPDHTFLLDFHKHHAQFAPFWRNAHLLQIDRRTDGHRYRSNRLNAYSNDSCPALDCQRSANRHSVQFDRISNKIYLANRPTLNSFRKDWNHGAIWLQ